MTFSVSGQLWIEYIASEYNRRAGSTWVSKFSVQNSPGCGLPRSDRSVGELILEVALVAEADYCRTRDREMVWDP